MTKIEEIYRNNWAAKYEGMDFRYNLAQQNHIYDAMKEYAEYYAQKCLEIAAAEAQTELVVDLNISNHPYLVVNLDSILNIQLPDHD